MAFFEVTKDNTNKLDFQSFSLNHSITIDHVNLDLIKNVIRDLPSHNIAYTSDSDNVQADFEHILRDKTQYLDAEKVTQDLLHSKSYLALSNVEQHPLLKGLCDQITQEIRLAYHSKIKGANYWIFVASPNAITPFHFDRFSNFIFQLRGNKELTIFPNFNDQVLNPEDCEKYCNGKIVKAPWKDEMDELGTKYILRPGMGAHIPFTSAHHLKNGTDDISITISVFFHSPRTIIWSRAMRFNDCLKQFLKKFKINLKEIRPYRKRNYLKAYLLPLSKLVK